MLRALLGAGAGVDDRDEQGITALLAAAGGGHEQAVGVLLDAGAGVNYAPAGGGGGTALYLASALGQVGVVRVLLARARGGLGVALEAAGGEEEVGDSALGAAARGGHAEVVGELLAAGASKAFRNRQGQTAGEIARSAGHFGVADAYLW